MRRAASVASAFIEATAAWRPRITGRMVRGIEASEPWAMAFAAKPKQAINKHILFETVMSASPQLKALGLRTLASPLFVHCAFYTV